MFNTWTRKFGSFFVRKGPFASRSVKIDSPRQLLLRRANYYSSPYDSYICVKRNQKLMRDPEDIEALRKN